MPSTHILETLIVLSLQLPALIHEVSDPHAVLQEVTPLGKQGLLNAEYIYPIDSKPTPQCHASTLVQTSEGLVAAWFGGTHEKHKDVGIWVSRHRDERWTAPVEVANGVQSQNERYPCWNPVLFQPRHGPLMLFYKVGPTPDSWWGMLMTSTDHGKTWGKPRKLGENDRIGHLIGPVKNKPIQLDDGSLLCPSSTEHQQWRIHFEISQDMGQTWQVIGPIHEGKHFEAIQPSILVYSNQHLQILCRTRQGVIGQSWSTDGGRTWSLITATSLPNPNAGTDAVTLSDGRQLLVYNHTKRDTHRTPHGRQMLNIAISRDGKHWHPALTLERSDGEFSYPAVIQTHDGKIHITYTFRRVTIKHVTIDPTRIGN